MRYWNPSDCLLLYKFCLRLDVPLGLLQQLRKLYCVYSFMSAMLRQSRWNNWMRFVCQWTLPPQYSVSDCLPIRLFQHHKYTR